MADSASILSAEWINQRVVNVLDQIDAILDRVLFDGLLSSGYLPLEQPVTKAMLRKMPPEQIIALLAALPTPEERVAVLKLLDLDADELYAMLEPPTVEPEGV